MNQNYKKYLIALTLLFVLGLSAITNVTVYADEATPEAPIVSEETVEVTEQESAQEEALPSTPEVGTESETSDLTESVENIIESLPEDTSLVVLDEEGQALPLASEEAAQAIVVGDPIWCPATVAVPVAGMNGCSGSYATFALLLADLIFASGGPASDGVIWVEKTYIGEGATAFISGGTLTTMKDYKLTIKGSWNGLGTGTVDTTTPSVFNAPLVISGWNNDVTISDIKVENGVVVGPYGVSVNTTGNITINRVSVVDNNLTSGAFLDNTSGTGNVTVTDSSFNNNNASSGGLEVVSSGTITLKNVTANDNGTGASGPGVYLNNLSSSTFKAITVTNVTTNNNQNSGLVVFSDGLITVTDITAINNGVGTVVSGVVLDNSTGTAGVTLNGTNLFYDNSFMGLQIITKGAVKASNLQAIYNGYYGISIANNSAATPQPVTLTGSNVFKFNGDDGLYISSLGTVTLNNITASFNTDYGTFIDNSTGGGTGDVKLTGNNTFFDNSNTGLQVSSKGMILLNNITASSNGNIGAYLDNTPSALFKAVTLTGTNVFDSNAGYGLQIISDGVVTTSNLTVINNGAYGVLIDNDYSTATPPKAVFVNGTNNISYNNGTGLFIESHGAITVSNLTANFNGQGGSGYGAELRNASGTLTPAPVTLNGNNTFNGNRDLGLYVISLGTIKTNNVVVKDATNGGGVLLDNSGSGGVGDVLMLGVNQFTDNNSHNLSIYSKGNVTLSNIIATGSATGFGVNIDNSTASTPKNVTISGTNFVNDNFSTGLAIYSIGVISLNNVSANNNGAGAYLDNATLALIAKDVKLTGTNTFSNNVGTGLTIFSRGNIVVNNLTANDNNNPSSYGAYLNNDYVGSVGNVTLSGTNKLNDNNETNLHIESYGVVTINNLTANSSDTNVGAYIINTNPSSASKAVTLTGVNSFSYNDSNNGLTIFSQGVITTNNITAISNGIIASGNGVSLSNATSTTLAGITMNGTNIITDNKSLNLDVSSLGNIKINNLNASFSVSGGGAFISNDQVGATGNVTLTGTNQFMSNLGGTGLQIYSKGAISINNITADANSADGVNLYNLGSTELVTNKPITITGYIITVYNGSDGLEIDTYSNIVINNLTSENNTFNGAYLDQDHPASITPVAITINGTNNINYNSSDGLVIETLGTITLNNINASSNTGVGLVIDANSPNAIGTITLKGTNTFNGNSIGLLIDSNSSVTLSSITANDNSSTGADIDNTTSITNSSVTLTGTNTFNNNGTGLFILSKGAITVNALTANDNNSTGATLVNASSPTSASVTLTGKNTFNGNTTGLFIQTSGNITTNSITANSNSSHGVSLSNTFDATTSSITMKGINTFSYNGGDGMLIDSNGAVTLTKFTADGNTGNGVTINVTGVGGNVSLTCGSTNHNSGVGLVISLNTPFTATITGLVSFGNIGNATSLMGTGTYTQLRGCPLP